MSGGLPSRQLTTTQATIKLLHGPSISIMSAALRIKSGGFVNANVPGDVNILYSGESYRYNWSLAVLL